MIHLGCNFTIKDLHDYTSIKFVMVVFFISISPSPVLWPWKKDLLKQEAHHCIEIYVKLEKAFFINLRNYRVNLIQNGPNKQEHISLLRTLYNYSTSINSENILPSHLFEGLQVLVIRHSQFYLVLCNPSGMYWQLRGKCSEQISRNTKI